MMGTEQEFKAANALAFDNDEMIWEVRLLAFGRRKGWYLFDHWFKGTEIEAEMKQLELKMAYAHKNDQVKIKIQPHLLRK